MMESRDATKWLVEQAETLRKDYVAARLRELGYNDELQQSHRNDFVTVHVGDDVFGVVYVPEKRVLFWFDENVRERKRLDASYAEIELFLREHHFYVAGEEEKLQERAVYAVLRTRGQQWTAKEKD